MNNLNSPASPQSGFSDPDSNNFVSGDCGGEGFTKRERACIDLRIPESGDAELDALIEKARWQDFTVQFMAAMQSNPEYRGTELFDIEQVAGDAYQTLINPECTHATPTR